MYITTSYQGKVYYKVLVLPNEIEVYNLNSDTQDLVYITFYQAKLVAPDDSIVIRINPDTYVYIGTCIYKFKSFEKITSLDGHVATSSEYNYDLANARYHNNTTTRTIPKVLIHKVK